MLAASGTIIRGLAVVALAAATVAAVQGPAAAFPLKQYVSASSLKAHCDAAGGQFAQNGSVSACATDKGDVVCDSKSHSCRGHTEARTTPPTGPARVGTGTLAATSLSDTSGGHAGFGNGGGVKVGGLAGIRAGGISGLKLSRH